MWAVARYASWIIFALALINTLGHIQGSGVIFHFNETQAALTFLFAVGFFMAAGLAFLTRMVKTGLVLATLGVLFAAKAATLAPEGGRLPWCSDSQIANCGQAYLRH